ncbi:Hypothetical protein Minf_1982 [Methylacidiphilum infernorum V4]|uniref:Uncharacterized protein n=1 Tax=Methylacidiphilum infernorum (isolate V4) TaxID=481448 RepID=B3DYI8_METI4|nr:Hypothetical protein Minf_1982 [Methylacidiphilum infernorum V4]
MQADHPPTLRTNPPVWLMAGSVRSLSLEEEILRGFVRVGAKKILFRCICKGRGKENTF